MVKLQEGYLVWNVKSLKNVIYCDLISVGQPRLRELTILEKIAQFVAVLNLAILNK